MILSSFKSLSSYFFVSTATLQVFINQIKMIYGLQKAVDGLWNSSSLPAHIGFYVLQVKSKDLLFVR